MSITSAKSGGTGISLALDNNYMEPIATTLVGSGGINTIIFNDIPQTYKHLQIRMLARTNRADVNDTAKLIYNSDTNTNNSTYHEIMGSGAAVSAYGSAAPESNQILVTAGNSAAAGIFGVGITDILDYTNTSKYKTQRNIGGIDRNGSGSVVFNSGLWMSTSAIFSIRITPSSGTLFQEHTRFSLYGIKG